MHSLSKTGATPALASFDPAAAARVDHAAVAAYPKLARARALLVMLVAAYIVSLIDRQVLALMVAPVRQTLGITDFQMSLLQGFAFAIFYGVLGIPLGRWIDRGNRKRILAAGIFVWSLATIACGFAESFVALFICRIFVGVGEATLAPAGYSLLADSFEPRHSVRTSAIFSASAMVGGGLALVVGGSALDAAGELAPRIFGGYFLPWQLVFVAVGLPGVLLSALLLLAVREPVRLGRHEAVTARAAFAFLWGMRRFYGPYYVCSGLLAMLTFSNLGWLPSHFIRVFGMTPTEAGSSLGGALLAGCVCGALLSPKLTDHLLRRGQADAHMRVVMLVSLALTVPVLGPLLHDRSAALVAVFVYFTLQNSYTGPVMAAMQKATPNAIRGTNTALYFLVLNVTGMGFGMALTAWTSDHLFAAGPTSIGKGIALVSCTAALASAAIAAISLKHCRQEADRLDQSVGLPS